jgi:putative transposon-encoded protein
VATKKNITTEETSTLQPPHEMEQAVEASQRKVKFEVFGEEMLEKNVKLSGNSGRVYLPPDWVGHRVKVIRID